MADIPQMQLIDAKKFMWDGVTYDTRAAADEAAAKYKADRFETRVVPVESAFAVYSRRPVSAS
jgi:hypothetical protein